MDDFGEGFSSTKGSDTCDTCVIGYFRSGDDCVACTPGMTCDEEGVTLEQLPVVKHHFRFSEGSNGIYSCEEFKYAENCLGSSDSINTSATTASNSRRLDGTSDAADDAVAAQTWGDATCLPTAEGPLCGVCKDGSYFDDTEQQCVECGTSFPLHSVVAICSAVVLLACIVAYTFFRKQVS